MVRFWCRVFLPEGVTACSVFCRIQRLGAPEIAHGQNSHRSRAISGTLNAGAQISEASTVRRACGQVHLGEIYLLMDDYT